MARVRVGGRYGSVMGGADRAELAHLAAGGARAPPGVEPSGTPGGAGSGCVSQRGEMEEVGGRWGGSGC